MPRDFKRGNDFPHEGFVQSAIEAHFRKLGFTLDTEQRIDLICSHRATDEQWHIEAKGHTENVGLDFRTGLGQLVQAMDEESTKYGIAVPDTPQFRAQIAKVSSRVTQLLHLHWLFVAADGSVQVITP